MKTLYVVVAGLLTALLLFSPASALQYDLSQEYSGGTNPIGTTPWLTAVFENYRSDSVKLTMWANGLADGAQKIVQWNFNFIGSMDPTKLGFQWLDEADPRYSYVQALAIKTGVNTLSADGSHGYDIQFDFGTKSSDDLHLFSPGEKSVYIITLPGSVLDASYFNDVNDPGSQGGHG